MSAGGDNSSRADLHRLRRQGVLAAVLAFVSVLAAVLYYVIYYPRHAGQAQPIAFSHRFHAGQKEIGCFMCHTGTLDSRFAGLPPVSRCMLCHERVIVGFPEIRELKRHYDQNEPISWNRVNSLPEHVFFSHERHVRSGVDCGRCHGDVKAMDRIVQPQEFTMGFCVQCHRDNGVSHDCLRCHR
jgi:hypothetical protein